MIIVTGSITARPEALARAKEISLEHVRRSRGERGCLSHEVAIDAEDANRLVFFESWADMGALQEHFAQEASRAFAREASKLSATPPTLSVYEAKETTPARPAAR